MGAEFNKKIILEDGQEYYGYGFGDEGERICEIVFQTSMVGYQEILSDPSYTDQAVVMTYPLIGNYGMADDDYESAQPSMGALIVREYNDRPSNFRSTISLGQVMKRYHIPGVYGIDTRKLSRSIRDLGSRKAFITDASTSPLKGLKILEGYRMRTDQVSRVSRREIQVFHGDRERYHVVAIDCGIKKGIVKHLNRLGCKVTVVPWNISAKDLEQLHPDGIFISNGPGNPESVPETVRTVKAVLGRYPVFGICLGHQIISLAYGAKTYKLKFGHRGGNHPVKNLETGKIEITSQNHSFAVDMDSLAGITDGDGRVGVKGSCGSAEEAHMAEWENMQILKALHRLKEPVRETLYLRLIGNLTFKQIGEIMGRSENWARVTFYRGKEIIMKEGKRDEP